MSITQLTPEQWYDLLFGDATGWVSIFAQNRAGNNAVLWARDAEAFARHTQTLTSYNVWFGCATRAESRGGLRGGKEDCLEVPGVWVDIDVKGPHHAADNLPPNDAAGIALLKSFPLRPS